MIQLKSSETPNNFWKRAWIYSKEMLPVTIYLPYVVSLYFCLNTVIQILNTPIYKSFKQGLGGISKLPESIYQAGSQVVLDSTSIAGVVTAFFMMLLMRTFDDLKDFELDAHLFPHRATARKLVLKSDIQLLSLSRFIIVVLVNLIWGQQTLMVFTIMIIYVLLTFKWFFAEKFHREHIFITMLDHQPLPYVINFFLIHTALASGTDYESFNIVHLFLLLIVSMPITAWEVSRKIRSADMETEYETFSMVIGLKLATLIPLIFFMIVGLLSMKIGNILYFDSLFYYVIITIMTIVLFFYLRFLIKPISKYNVLTKVSLFATTMFFLNLLVNTLLHYSIF